MITALVTGLGSIFGPILAELVPDADKRAELQSKLDTQLASLVRDATTAQLEINKVEAAHPSIFVSGWRPAIGWICAITLFWGFVGRGFADWLMAFTCILAGLPVPPELPAVESELMLELVFAMLGMGGLRTWEKMKGVARS